MGRWGTGYSRRGRALRLSAAWPILVCGLATAAAPSSTTATKTFDLAIPATAATGEPRVLRVTEDDVVQLRVTSDVAGEIHLHAYRLHARVAPDAPAELNFTARATGRFRIEWHAAGAPKTNDHHGLPLATLEVWPH